MSGVFVERYEYALCEKAGLHLWRHRRPDYATRSSPFPALSNGVRGEPTLNDEKLARGSVTRAACLDTT